MDCPPYVLDLLLLLSATMTCIVGTICGWTLRSYSAPPSATIDDAFLDHRTLTTVPAVWDGESFEPRDVQEATDRLIQIADRIRHEEAGDDLMNPDVRVSSIATQMPTSEEIVSLLQALMREREVIRKQLCEAESRLLDQSEQIVSVRKLANTDALTELGNRRAFDEALTQWNGQTPGAIAMFDIDHFKKFNDEHGRQAGDVVLRTVARLLTENLSHDHLIARYGGGVFSVVFNNLRLERAIEIVEHARTTIGSSVVPFHEKNLRVTCSLGITRMVACEPSDQWMQRVDDALYMSKFAGRDCGHCIDCLRTGEREKPYRLQSGNVPALSSKPTLPTSSSVPASSNALTSPTQSKPSSPRMGMVPETNETDALGISDVDTLGQSYHDLMQRIGKARTELSVITIQIASPEMTIPNALASLNKSDDAPVTRIMRLHKVVQGFCRAVDRVGRKDSETLFVCMPGIGQYAVDERIRTLMDSLQRHMNVPGSELTIGHATAEPGDEFGELLRRAAQSESMMS